MQYVDWGIWWYSGNWLIIYSFKDDNPIFFQWCILMNAKSLPTRYFITFATSSLVIEGWCCSGKGTHLEFLSGYHTIGNCAWTSRTSVIMGRQALLLFSFCIFSYTFKIHMIVFSSSFLLSTAIRQLLLIGQPFLTFVVCGDSYLPFVYFINKMFR